MIRFLALACLALAACVPDVQIAQIQSAVEGTRPTAAAPQVAQANQTFTEPHIIHNDPGGNLLRAEARRAMLAAWGGQVEISGFCNSACAIYATLPNACIHPRAVIGFHSANVNLGNIGNPQVTKYLRNGVREKWLAEWQFVPNSDIHHIWGKRFVELDPESKLCE